MTDRDFVLAPARTTVTVDIGLEPVYNLLNDLLLLAGPDDRSGFSAWVKQASASLSPAESHFNRLVHKVLFHAIEPDAEQHWTSFPAYIDALAAEDPAALVERSLHWLCSDEFKAMNAPDQETLLRNRQAYISFIEQIHAKKAAEGDKEITFEAAYFEEAHRLFNNPPELQARLVSHLRFMWEQVLSPEWARVQPMLQESVDAFRQLDYSGMTALEAVRVVTGRDLSGIWDNWPKHITFVPSAHIGPYVTRFDTGEEGTSYVIFGARLPEGARMVSPALSRSELLVRLNALADDTRLLILELLTKHDELCAQDVIEMLNLSQSAASRHLRQLTATGYLIERRREVAKCYSLNPQRVDDTLRALKRFLHPK
jgi:DNA-binding transcriptional ArsR family regulator